MRTYYRAADNRDLKAMTRGRGSLRRNLLTTSLPLAAFIFLIIYAVFRSIAAASIVSGLLLIASVVSNIRFFAEVQHRSGLTTNPTAVEVTDVQPSRILDLEPVGDHGPAICCFTSDGRALLLIGQWLLDYRSFPAASFRLHRWADTRKPIRIETTGRRIRPEQSTVQIRTTYRINDVEFFNATPETLQDDLDRIFSTNTA